MGSHPPVPPNSEWFHESVFVPHVTNVQPSLDTPGEWRYIISCVAQSEWQKWYHSLPVPYLPVSDRREYQKQFQKYHEACREWKKWGEIK